MTNLPKGDLSKRGANIHQGIQISKVYLPIIIGLVVIVWMIYTQLDLSVVEHLNDSWHTIFWLFISILVYFLRHLFYTWRLRIITQEFFTWWKSFKLIVIWEFASAVSPTTVGGSGVALYLLSKEQLSGAKTITAVLYTMVLDTIYYLTFVPLLFIIIGFEMIRPNMLNSAQLDGYGYTFFIVLVVMFAYGFLFYYGLFINPKTIRKLLVMIGKMKLFRKFRHGLYTTAHEIEQASLELKSQPMIFHIKSFTATVGAWVTRFLGLNCIIIAIVAGLNPDLYEQILMLGRGHSMHIITSFSPTPGGVGIAEYLFGGFFSDFIVKGVEVLVAVVWRLITYYSYLIVGVVVIPLWLKELRMRSIENH